VHIFRVGEYKSAVEPYSRTNMSEESRANYTQLLQDLWRNYYTELETRRELDAGVINDYVNNLDTNLVLHQGNPAALALAMGLVDRLDTRPAALAYLKSEIGAFGDELKAVDFLGYVRSSRPALDTNPNRVGIIVAQGTIVDGEAPLGQIGGDSMATLIREATHNDNIKALVLRIDSPGGSAFASEVIRAELEAFKATNRPIVVSMGSTAASGGYWIATPANQIWASPTTVTGSIGIFGVYPTFEESFTKLGIGTDGVGTTELAGYAAVGRPLTELASNSLQLQVQDGYNRFINLVSSARGMTFGEVDQIAQGQVWSGEAALGNGLVDQLGGLQDALEAAANLASISDYGVEWIQPRLSPTERLLREIMQNPAVQAALSPLAAKLAQGSAVEQLMQKLQIDVSWLLQANDPQHAYVDCLECRKVRL
jgi:protease-4